MLRHTADHDDGVTELLVEELTSNRPRFLVAGPPALMKQEHAFLKNLGKTTKLTVSKGILLLSNDDGSTTLKLSAATAKK